MHKHFWVDSNYSHLSNKCGGWNKPGGGVKNPKCGKASSVHQHARLERQRGFPEESLPSQSKLGISDWCTNIFGSIPTTLISLTNVEGVLKNPKCGKDSSVRQHARLERQLGFPEESLPSQSRLGISDRCRKNFGLIPTHIIWNSTWMKKNRAWQSSEAFSRSPCLAKADWRLAIDAQTNLGWFLLSFPLHVLKLSNK